MLRLNKLTAWLLIGLLTAVVAALLWLRLPVVSWQSSLVDTLPQEANPAHQVYVAQQQPNEQRFMLMFSVAKEDAELFSTALRQQLEQLSQGEPKIHPLDTGAGADFLQIYAAHAGQWATAADLQLLQRQPEQLITQAQQRLQQPTPLWMDIRQDPLLLSQRFVEALPEPLPGFENQAPLYIRSSAAQTTLLVALTSAADTLSQANARAIVARVDSMLAALDETEIPHQIIRSGLVFHTDAAASQAKQEITWFGGLSLAFVLVLLALVFRSFQHLVFSMLVLSVSTLFGVTAVVWLFSAPHVLTMVFATTLIGLCIDYVFHASIGASHGRKNWRLVVPALLLGAGTTIVGFLLLTLLSLPLLQQLGVFMAAALATVAGLVLLIPQLGIDKAPTASWQRLHFSLAEFFQRFSPRFRASLLLVLTLASCLAVWQNYRSDDSVRLLATSTPELLAQEQQMRTQTQAFYDADVILLQAPTASELQQRYAAAHRHLAQWQQEGWLSGWQSWYDYVPTPQQRQQTQAALQKLWQQPAGQDYLAWLGIDAPRMDKRATPALEQHPLQQDFIYSATAENMPAVGVIRLRGIAQREKLAQAIATLNGAELYNPLTQASEALGYYRIQLMGWMAALLLLLFAILCWRLPQSSWRQRCAMSLQVNAVIITALSSALAIAALWQPLNAFHLVGAMLVIVLGIDYGIFCASRVQRGHALQAISISALTTMFAFGALSFSQTAAIAAFGTTVLIGVAITAVLVPLLPTANSTHSV
ncbi:RND transporter [Pseudidiomarina sp.]|uniref:RND transporter n=1 Tax=Pseudidiomarina sp. TaxID=2081707 RepID=UPI003A98142A